MHSMKNQRLFILLYLIILFVIIPFSNCMCENANQGMENSTNTVLNGNIDFDFERTEWNYRKWYDEVISGLKQEDISISVANEKVTAEYRVVYNIALLGYDYYSLRVFSDGTGEFTFIIYLSEDFTKGEIILNETKCINIDGVQELLTVIQENNFFDIPTIHPDEIMGLDGTTVFIEGYENGKTHFIRMWEPDETYGIYKIHRAFADFSDSFIENSAVYSE